MEDLLIKEISNLNLYSRTGLDWELLITVSVTEPTVPVVHLRPEIYSSDSIVQQAISQTRWQAWGGTIEQGIATVIKQVRDDLDGSGSRSQTPWTNPGDKLFGSWVEQWRNGIRWHDPKFKIKP